MTSQAVMKRYINALAKKNQSNAELQKLSTAILNFKKLTKEQQGKVNRAVETAYEKLQAKGVSAKKVVTKPATTPKAKTTSTGGLKAIISDLKNQLGASSFKAATTNTNIAKDIKLAAYKKGKRIVRNAGKTTNAYGTFENKVGSTYYENRANRYDANQPSTTRKYKLANGGQIKYGIVNDDSDRIYFRSPQLDLVKLKLKEFQEIYPNEKIIIQKFAKGGNIDEIKVGDKFNTSNGSTFYIDQINKQDSSYPYYTIKSKPTDYPEVIHFDEFNRYLKNGFFEKVDGKFAKGGEVSHNFYAYTKMGAYPIESISFWKNRQNKQEPNRENIKDFLQSVPNDERVCIYVSDVSEINGNLHSDKTPAYAMGAEEVTRIVDSRGNLVWSKYSPKSVYLSSYAKGGTTSSLSSIRRKYDKNEDENRHSENVVLLATNFGDADDLKLAKEILRKHNEEGGLSSENGKKRQDLHLKLITKARQEFNKEGIEFAKGGTTKTKFKVGDKVVGQFRYDYGEGLQPVSIYDYADRVKGFISNVRKIDTTTMYSIKFDNGEELQYPDFAIDNFIVKSQYAKGGLTEHGLEVGDEIVMDVKKTTMGKMPTTIGVKDYDKEFHLVDLDKGERYAKGGKTDEDLYIDQLASMSATRATTIKEWASSNNLSKNDLLNIIQGLGRKQITASEFTGAVLGDKTDTSSIVSYAKSNSGFKMADGGDVSNAKNKKIMEEYRVEVSDLRNQSYPRMSPSLAFKKASEYMLFRYTKEELAEAIKSDNQIEMFGMEKTWLNALNKAKKPSKMANGGEINDQVKIVAKAIFTPNADGTKIDLDGWRLTEARLSGLIFDRDSEYVASLIFESKQVNGKVKTTLGDKTYGQLLALISHAKANRLDVVKHAKGGTTKRIKRMGC